MATASKAMRDFPFRRLADAVRIKDIMDPIVLGPELNYDAVIKEPAKIIYEILVRVGTIYFEEFSPEIVEVEGYDAGYHDGYLPDKLDFFGHSHEFEIGAQHGWDILENIICHINEIDELGFEEGRVVCDTKKAESDLYNMVCPVIESHRHFDQEHGKKELKSQIGFLQMRDYLNQSLTPYGIMGDGSHLSYFVDNNIILSKHFTSGEISALSFLETIEAKSETYIVIVGIKPVGFIGYKQFLGPIFRLIILSAIFELEETALRLILRQPENPWTVLPETDRQRVKRTFGSKFQDQPPDVEEQPQAILDLLSCTTLADKDYIIRKMKLLPDISNASIEKLFKKVEKVRNACAHTGGDEHLESLLPSASKLSEFLKEIEECVDRICGYMPIEPESWINKKIREKQRVGI